MSDDTPFELEPPAEHRDPVVAPRRSRLRRKERAAPAREPRGKAGWARRLACPLVSPAGYYLIGLLLSAGVLLCLYNPSFGTFFRRWPHEVFEGGFRWQHQKYWSTCLAAVSVGCLLALLMRAGRARGLIVLTGVLFAHFGPGPRERAWDLLPMAIALAGGALVARPNPGREGGRKSVLVVALVLLGALLFLPWDAERLEREGQSGYYANALATMDEYRHPPADGVHAGRVAAPTAGCLMIAVALLALLGLGRKWARWAAGSVMVGLVLAWGLNSYFRGQGPPPTAGLEAWQEGLQALGWLGNDTAWVIVLPLAGAVAELIRGRGEP